MKDYLEMALEDLREDLEGVGEEAVVDEEGNLLNPPEEVNEEEHQEQLSHLMAIESLLTREGLVSRKVAEEIKDYLPEEIAVESFTSVPTRVNYGIAVESVGGAIKLVALAGVAVLIGGLGVMIYRILKRAKKLPNNELARKATAAFASIENKLKTAVDELKAAYPNVKHPQMNWSRSDAAIRVAAGQNVREIEARVLAGKYPFMDNKLLQAATDQGKRILTFIKSSVMPQIDQLSNVGTDEDISALSKSIEGFDVGESANIELKRYVESLGAKVENDASPIEVFREVLLQPVPQDKLKERVGEVNPEFKEVDVRGAKGLIGVRDEFTAIYQKLESLSKKLEGKKSNLPAAYAAKFKELIELTKSPLKSLDSVLEIHDQETVAFNRVTAIKLETTKEGFVNLKSQYEQFAAGDKVNEGLYKKVIGELASHFNNFKEAIK